MNRQTSANVPTTISTDALLRFDNKQPLPRPATAAVGCRAADPERRVWSCLVQSAVHIAARFRTIVASVTTMAQFPWFTLKPLLTLFAGQDNARRPSRIVFTANLIRGKCIGGPFTTARGIAKVQTTMAAKSLINLRRSYFEYGAAALTGFFNARLQPFVFAADAAKPSRHRGDRLKRRAADLACCRVSRAPALERAVIATVLLTVQPSNEWLSAIRACFVEWHAIIIPLFAGSGTTGRVAIEHNRNAVLIDLNAEYGELQKQHTDGVQRVLL